MDVELEDRNFEEIYSELHDRDPNSSLLKTLEAQIREYFVGLQLPSTPTLYDHLLISLRPRDLVATFNWDPFLFDAWNRLQDRLSLPEILHLHGGVRIGYCAKHRVQGSNGRECPECGSTLIQSPLLYPIASKDYSSDAFIRGQWSQLKTVLRQAFTLTIFGYGAPTTDKDAVGLMESAWIGPSGRVFERVEIVDIKEREALAKTWEHFIPSETHYDIRSDFYESYIPNHPRRSCESLHASTVEGLWVEECRLPTHLDLDGLAGWADSLVDAEREVDHRWVR